MEEFLSAATTHLEWTLVILSLIIILLPPLLEKFKLPGLLGLVLGGMLVGPFVLNLFKAGSLDALGGIGLLYLMFLAGVELDLNLFQRFRNAAIIFGIITFLLPFSLILFISLQEGFSTSGAILMGSVFASHTLVAYPIVRQSGLANNKAVASAVGATVLTDTIALSILAVISGTASSEAAAGTSGTASALLKVGLALVILVTFTLILLPKIAGWFFAGPGQSSLGRFVFIFGAMSFSGLFAGLMGIEGLVGAFFAGIGLNKYVPNGGRLMGRVEFFGNALFVPAFLISVGMLINPAVIFNKQTIFLALMLGGGLFIGKFAAAFITGKLYKFSFPEIGTMFSLTFAQAAATLASALVGLKLGLFTNDVVNAVLLVVLISLIISSIGTSFFSSRVKPESVSINPVGRAIMVLIQQGTSLRKIMKLAAAIAHNDAGVVSPISIALEYQGEEAQQKALAILEEATKYGESETADVNATMRIDSSIHYGFIRELTENRGTLALVEWKTGPGALSFLFGNTVDRIGTRSPVPVAAVHFDSEEINRVLVVTGSKKPTAGYFLDLKIGLKIAERLTKKLRIPYIIIAQQKTLPEDVSIPKNTKIVKAEPGIENVLPHIEAGDLVIVNWATIHGLIGNKAEELKKASSNISIMITAGPHRLSLSSTETPYNPDSIISFGTASAD